MVKFFNASILLALLLNVSAQDNNFSQKTDTVNTPVSAGQNVKGEKEINASKTASTTDPANVPGSINQNQNDSQRKRKFSK